MSSKSGLSKAAERLETYRILLVGKTGNGKSALGNMLLGQKKFQSKPGLSSVTKNCQMESAELQVTGKKMKIEVVDTPGFSDTDNISNDEVKEVIAQFLADLAPGPHAVLVTVKGHQRFTEDEYAAYCEAVKLFTDKNPLRKRMIIIFTHNDILQRQSFDLEKDIQDKRAKDDTFQTMMENVQERYAIVDNLTKDEKIKALQLDTIITKIKEIAPDESSYLTNDLQNDVTKAVDEDIKRKMNDLNISKEEARKQTLQDIVTGSNTKPSKIVSGHFEETKAKEEKIKICLIL